MSVKLNSTTNYSLQSECKPSPTHNMLNVIYDLGPSKLHMWIICGLFLSFLQVKIEGHGSWAAEDSVPAKECQEGSREEERSGRWPEDCSEGRTGPHLPCLPGKYSAVLPDVSYSWILIRCNCRLKYFHTKCVILNVFFKASMIWQLLFILSGVCVLIWFFSF